MLSSLARFTSKIGKVVRLRDVVATFSFTDIPALTISIGVARYHNGDDINTLLSRADHALYQAKDQGRNCVVLASD